MKRGAVVVVRAKNSPASKSRPCVIVQRDATLDNPPKVTVCPLSSKLRGTESGRPLVIPDGGNGLRTPSEIGIDWLHTFPAGRIGQVLGHLEEGVMRQVDEALRHWLSL